MQYSSGVIAVSNLHDGFDMYDIEEREHIAACITPIKENVPLPILFTSTGPAEVIVGSSCGYIYIRNASDLREAQRLCHKEGLSSVRSSCAAEFLVTSFRYRKLDTGPCKLALFGVPISTDTLLGSSLGS